MCTDITISDDQCYMDIFWNVPFESIFPCHNEGTSSQKGSKPVELAIKITCVCVRACTNMKINGDQYFMDRL